MAKPISFASITLADNTKKSNGKPETSSTEFAIPTLTPVNAAATVTLVGNLKTALAGLVLGRFLKDEIVWSREKQGPQTPADDPLAQRENKWLASYHDPVSYNGYVLTFPTADLSKHMANSEFVDLTAGDGLAFKTAFDAVVASPEDASRLGVLDTLMYVGRNT